MDEESFGQVRDAVRRFVRERVIPEEEEIEASDAIPDDVRDAAAELGLFGYALPAEFGGIGVSMSQDVRLAFEFGYTAPAAQRDDRTRPGATAHRGHVRGRRAADPGRVGRARRHQQAGRPADRGLPAGSGDARVQVHGGLGYMASTVVERKYRDSRLYRLYEGTSEIQKLIIARELLSAARAG